MAIKTFANRIGNPDHGKLLERIVYDEIGNRPGDWLVTLTEPAMHPEWAIEIEGPNGFKWSETFFGIEEQDLSGKFIRHKVRLALMAQGKIDVTPGQTCSKCGTEVRQPRNARIDYQGVGGKIMIAGDCPACGAPVEVLAQETLPD